MNRRPLTLAGAVTAGALTAALVTVPALPVAAAAPARLTNLDHLDFLGDRVSPPRQAGHTTYRLGARPRIGTLWTYAEHQPDGSYRRVGGGTYDANSDTYGQGAFNADDMARASVVYLRDWQQTGAASSRRAAYQLLRGVTYLQTVQGPHAGNVVLWMQPDGTLDPSAEPKELPDPSDSGASYWLARTIWALGEGYADFRRVDPGFARFLAHRLDLAVGALRREVLVRYGRYHRIDGQRTPAWLVADGADASAEAALGLAAYVRAGGGPAARRALRQLGDGIAAMSAGDATHWPFGAVRPWSLSLSDWHAWASQMPAALARAGAVLHSRRLVTKAAKDSFVFTPWLLTSGGPDNGRLPTRVDASQIAYGVDSRVESLMATSRVAGGRAARQLAGLTAAWFFGANASGAPTYDPATGVTVDGVAPDGTVNQNSGAESTIHGLLTMLQLDAHPRVARIARTAAVADRRGTVTLQAEDAVLAGAAHAVAPTSTWTGESQYGGTGYAALGAGGSATFTVDGGPAARVVPVVDLRPGSTAVTTWTARGRTLGEVRSGAIGPQGDSPALGALLPRTLPGSLTRGPARITATATAQGGDTALLDALMLEPAVSYLTLGRGSHGSALLRSAADTARRAVVQVPGHGRARVSVYDGHGRLLRARTAGGPAVRVLLPAGGFAVVLR